VTSPEATTAPPGADHPQEKRTCSKCATEKVVTPETWPYRRGRQGQYQAHGARCLACEKIRKAEYEARRDKIAAAIATIPDVDPKGKPDDKRKALAKHSKLDVAHALKAGSHVLNEYAPAVMARILEYFEDPDSPHHQWALELLAERVLPRKLYEELGGQAAGAGSLADKRPTFILNVHPATPEHPQGASSTRTTATGMLPAPSEDSEPT
jgi:hypothetical protein